MLFKTTRSLKDKVFGTSISFVDFGERDSLGFVDNAARVKEQALLDDFGAPKISVGKEFTGYIQIEDGKVKLVEEALDAKLVKFIIADKQVEVTTGFVASIAIDAKKEYQVTPSLTSEQEAEAKCLIFEKVITQRLQEAILNLKSHFTTFEEEPLAEISIPFPVAPTV